MILISECWSKYDPWFTKKKNSNSDSDSGGLIPRARIFKRLWSPGIDSKEWIPPAYAAWRAGTITLFLLGS
jgi:hypothetical protein